MPENIADDPPTFAVDLRRTERFRFDVSFDDPAWKSIQLDEPEPLGEDSGPNATRMLAAAVGNCLAASLLFCLQKARVDVTDLSARVEGVLERNERGMMRVGALRVMLRPSVGAGPPERLRRCLELFEDFCVVTQSVRDGIEVDVDVEPTHG